MLTRTQMILILLVLNGFLMASCAKKTSPTTATTGDPTELEGTWATGCVAAASSKDTIIVSGNTYTDTLIFFAETTCVTQTQKEIKTGTFTLGAAAAAPANAKTTDFILNNVSETPLRADVASDFNIAESGAGFCGIKTWALDTETSISGKTCSGGKIPSAGETRFNIYTLTTTVIPNTLAFGVLTVTNNGTIATKRPTSIDADEVFKKQ